MESPKTKRFTAKKLELGTTLSQSSGQSFTLINIMDKTL